MPSNRAAATTAAVPFAVTPAAAAALLMEDLFAHGAPTEYAAYAQTLADLVGIYPGLGDPPSNQHPITRIPRALSRGMRVMAWMAGVRTGAAYEHLRLAVVEPRQLCRRCHSAVGEPSPWCPECGGAGTVPGRRRR